MLRETHVLRIITKPIYRRHERVKTNVPNAQKVKKINLSGHDIISTMRLSFIVDIPCGI